MSELKSDRAKGVLEPRPWGHIGRTAFATHGELEALLAERTEGGEVFDKPEIKAKLRELKLEQLRRKGDNSERNNTAKL